MTNELIRTTDNNRKIVEIESDRKNLSHIANGYDFDIEKNPNLLVFPQNWQLGIKKSDKIFELDRDGKLTTNNIMGFIGYKETKLAISSRFYSNGNDYFLHYMLSKVLKINVVNLNFSKGEEDIHDFLPYLFPSYLQNAFSQGLYKQYKRNQHNDANVKGVIDINRHIRINLYVIQSFWNKCCKFKFFKKRRRYTRFFALPLSVLPTKCVFPRLV